MDVASNPSELDLGSQTSLSVSVGEQIRALEMRYASRGLVKAVQNDADEQQKREEATRELEPLSYRLSTLSARGLDKRYRGESGEMRVEELLTYIHDTRALRTREADFSAVTPNDESVHANEAQKPCTAVVRGDAQISMKERMTQLPFRVLSLPAKAVEAIRISRNSWFNASPADTSRNTHRFPLSAFGAILAVAMSLMLIVASSVLINQGESRVNSLKMELSDMGGEVSELKSDLEVKNDLLKLRDVAVNEYGMVSEEFVRMDYLSVSDEDFIEVFEEEGDQNVGLGALLSAIGLK